MFWFFLLFSHTKPLNLLLSHLYPFLLCKQQIQKDLFWHKIENLSYFNSMFHLFVEVASYEWFYLMIEA